MMQGMIYLPKLAQKVYTCNCYVWLVDMYIGKTCLHTQLCTIINITR